MQILRLLPLLILLISADRAYAHKASDGFLYLDLGANEPATLQVELALRDLALVIPLDQNRDRQVTGEELRLARPDILNYLQSHLTVLASTARCQLIARQWGLTRHSDGPYAATRFQLDCPGNALPSALQYHALFDQDGLHRGLLQVNQDGDIRLTALTPEHRSLTLDAPTSPVWSTLVSFLYEGIIHLLIGLDHLLFLLVIMLPATLISARAPSSASDNRFLSGLRDLAAIVTAFTVAHSITLALAVFKVVTPPIAWVEIIIALSVALAALNIRWPILGEKSWKLAFGFGLIHGFGFASVLAELTAGTTQTVAALAGFNIGVEIGQLLVLAVTFPLLYLMGQRRWYREAAVPAVLVAIIGTSLFWVAERTAAI